MKKQYLLMITMLVAMIFLATGCQKTDENKYFLVSENFVDGYGSKVKVVYVQNNGDLYAVGDATDASAYEKYGIGIDFSESHGATGIYFPLAMDGAKTEACLSYGDIAPVVLDRKKDTLVSKERYEKLSFYPCEFVGYNDYASAMTEYNQIADDFANIEKCRVYKINSTYLSVYSSGKASDGSVAYDISYLDPGLYFVGDTFGIVEIR